MHQVNYLCARSTASKVSQKTTKKPELSAIKKKQKHKPKKKPDYIESSDDDFVEQCPGPSKSNQQSAKQLSEKEVKNLDLMTREEDGIIYVVSRIMNNKCALMPNLGLLCS